MEQFQRIALRFLRGFVAGGLTSSAALLALGTTITSLEDLKKFGIALAVAFGTGGLLALDKLIREYLAESEA